MNFNKLLFVVSILLVPFRNAFAYGITVSPVEFVIENLKIGQSYDLSKMAQPFSVSYGGSEQMDLVIDCYRPNEPSQGYEVIPDTSWVKTDKEFYPALPGESVPVTIALSIPNDAKYLGKKYDVRLRTSLKPRLSLGATGVAPAVEIRILFSIFQERGSAAEQANFEEMMQKTRNISFTPSELVINDIPVGRTIDIKKEFKKSLKLTNLNEDSMVLQLKCILPRDIGLNYPGYESLDNINFVKFSKEKVKLNPNQVEEIKIFFDFPDKPQYHNKNFLVICEAAIVSNMLRTQYRTRIFISTK